MRGFMTGTPKIYLSGAMEYVPDGGADWRTRVEKTLGYADLEVFNPCTSGTDLLSRMGLDVDTYHKLKYGTESEFTRFQEITNVFIDLDLAELRTSHLVLAKLCAKGSGGTAGELTVARVLGIPVIAFCEDEISDVSGWVGTLPEKLFLGPDSERNATLYLLDNLDDYIAPPSFPEEVLEQLKWVEDE